VKIDYEQLVEDYDISELTLRKVTNKYIREHFDIETLKRVKVLGDGDKENNSEKSSANEKPKIKNIKKLNSSELLMGHEMPVSIWLGYLERLIEGEFIRAIREGNNIVLVTYDKEKKEEVVEFKDLPEQEIIEGLKQALKQKIRKAKNGKK